MTVLVRRIRADEAATLRSIRLAALADSPSAFLADVATEAAMADDQWDDRARRGSDGHDAATFLAFDGAVPVGLVTGLRHDPEDLSLVELVSMWTSPVARRRGVGRSLVEAVLDWADETSSAVELWVVRGNDSAEALYRSLGFVDVGDFEPMPSDPCRDELRMHRSKVER